MSNAADNGWAMEEFSNVALGDERLNKRLIKLCDSLSEAPESPINQACGDWAETKAASILRKRSSRRLPDNACTRRENS